MLHKLEAPTFIFSLGNEMFVILCIVTFSFQISNFLYVSTSKFDDNDDDDKTSYPLLVLFDDSKYFP